MSFSQTTSRATYRTRPDDTDVSRVTSSARGRLSGGGLAVPYGRLAAREPSLERDRCIAGSQCRAGKPIVRLEGGLLLPPEFRGAVIALGNFDGFHFGHQAVVGKAVALARERGAAVIAATFDPHPVRHFAPDAAPFRLTTLDQRQRMFAASGVDAMMVFQFNGTLASVTPEDFVGRWLAGAGGVVTGNGFCFGRRRAGNVALLGQLASRHRMAYEAVDAIALDDAVVSSSGVRQALRQGDCGTATRLLTRPFAICGELRYGGPDGRSRDCGIAMVDLGGYVRPLAGCYAARLRLPDGSSVRCAARVGSAQAEGSQHDVLWLAVPDSARDVDGQAVEVDLLARMPAGLARAESAFLA